MSRETSFQVVKKSGCVPWGTYHLTGTNIRWAIVKKKVPLGHVAHTEHGRMVSFRDANHALGFLAHIEGYCSAGSFCDAAEHFIESQERPDDFAYFVNID